MGLVSLTSIDLFKCGAHKSSGVDIKSLKRDSPGMTGICPDQSLSLLATEDYL